MGYLTLTMKWMHSAVSKVVIRVLLVGFLAGVLAGCTSTGQMWTNPSEPGIQETTGSRHCDQQSLTFLEYDRTQYVSDPQGLVPPQWRIGDFEVLAAVPGSAVDTGYRAGSKQLWVADDGVAVYVANTDSGEVTRWPQLRNGFGCD
jgi:hypothetical protein